MPFEGTEQAWLFYLDSENEINIKDDKGFIHKFKLNMKPCVDHAKAKNTNENDPTESQENLFF